MPAKQLPALLLVLLLGVQTVAAAPPENGAAPLVSGTIVNGLRLLTIGPGQTDNELVVYRGDYIQPQLADAVPFEIIIPALDLHKRFPVVDGSAPYLKMTQVGRYPFTAGAYSGTIEVIPFSASPYTELTAAEAEQLISNIQPLLLDVRTPGEFQQGHLKGARLLPVQQLQQQLATLDGYQNRAIVIYCASGNRSTVAARILIENGFEKIYNLRHGYGDWVRQGLPVE